MDEIVKEFLAESYEFLDRLERDYRELIDLLARLNEGGATSVQPFLAPATAPATAVAVPASRCHAAVDPQPVAVVAPAPLPAALPATIDKAPAAVGKVTTRNSAGRHSRIGPAFTS
jgi:hypothetical protein